MKDALGINWYGPGGGAPALFVSSAGSGTEDGSSADNSLPVASLDVSTLANGTTVKLNRGETYDIGELDITQTGIVFDAYGTGDDPILRGSEDISGLTWTDEGGGVWSAPMVEEPNWIWISGVCAKLAETDRIPILSRGSTTTITIDNADVAGFTDIENSYLVAKDKKFSVSLRRAVTNYVSGTGVITTDGEIDVNNNVDLVLYNKFEFFVGNNEWAWEAGELRVKAAASPATLDIRMSAFDYCFKTTSNTVFKNLEFAEYYQFGVWSDGGAIDVNNCSFHDFRDSAVLIEHGVTGANVSDNSILRMGNNGITTRPCTNSNFDSNTISGVFMQDNYGWQTWVSEGGSVTVNDEQVNGCGIAYIIDLDDDTIDGSGCTFNDNKIDNIGYNGISLHVGTDNFVLRNTIHNYMNRFADGGGIYTFHYREYDVPQANTEIANNIIYDAINPSGEDNVAGIYLDNRTFAANVHDNVIYDIIGIGLRPNADTRAHTIEDNIIRNCSLGLVYINDGGDPPDELYEVTDGITFNRNILVCTASNQRCFEITTNEVSYNPFANGGEADNNYYIQPFTTAIADTPEGSNRTLAQWRSDYSVDANSVYLDNESSLITNETDAEVNGSLTGFSTHSLALASASSQAVNLGTNADIQFENNLPLTIHLKFKRNGNPASAEVIFSNLGATNRGIQVSISTTGQIICELRNTVGTNRYQAISSAGLMDNEWHTLIFTKPATFANSSLFIDGVSDLAQEQDNLTQTIVSTNDWFIGNRESVSAYFNGLVDQVAIWNSNQGPFGPVDNVSLIYNGGVSQDLALLADPPLHYWEINDGANDAAKFADTGDSANELTGAGVNAPTISTDVQGGAFVDIDLDPITEYTIPAHYGLIYLIP
jgi:hypothetical protein